MGVSSLLILLAKSEAPPIYLRRNPENHVWQRTGSWETDFASSIAIDVEPFEDMLHGADGLHARGREAPPADGQ
jgi:hypothetical protein